jgi:hypothetical protein
LPFLTFEPEIQAEIDQKWPKNPGKHLRKAHEVPVLVVIAPWRGGKKLALITELFLYLYGTTLPRVERQNRGG